MDDLDLFFDNLEEDLNDVILQEVVPIVENEVHLQSKRIYYEYTPYGSNKYESRYERQEDGSYGDRTMIDTEIQGSIKNGVLETITRNNSIAVGDEKGQYLDNIIEYGEKYGWSHKPPARPVFERAEEELHSSEKIENTIERSMKSRGYDIK